MPDLLGNVEVLIVESAANVQSARSGTRIN